jgi:hypothetical protein
MPNPTSAALVYNQVLTDMSIAYVQDSKRFIADKVFPVIPVDHQAGQYIKYNRGDWFRDVAAERAPGTESTGMGFDLDANGTFFNRVYATHADVDDQTRANYREPLDADRDNTKLVTTRLLLRRELAFSSAYFKTGIWTGTSGGGDKTGVSGAPGANQFKQWDQAGSTPIEDITSAMLDMGGLTGFEPNVVIFSAKVFNVLKQHAELLDRIKYTEKGVLTADLLASILTDDTDVPMKVLIAKAIQNTAAKGAADAMAYIYPKAALLAYAAPTPAIMEPSAGYAFSWTGYEGAAAYAPAISQFRMQHLKADRIEGEMAFDLEQVASDLGAFFTSAIA